MDDQAALMGFPSEKTHFRPELHSEAKGTLYRLEEVFVGVYVIH